MNRCCRAICLLLLFTANVQAQPAPTEEEVLSRIVLPGESQRTARRIVAATKLEAEGKWIEAVEEYQRILTEAEDDLVPLDARHSLQARRLCHARLAALAAKSPTALRLYRARVDSQAKKWLEEGTASRDMNLLRRLVEEAFCSRYTDQALDLLGDLAFERGAFEEAERWWRMLVVPAAEIDRTSNIKDALVFPDPKVDEALVRAKQILARLFRQDLSGLRQEWQAFQAKHGKAEGFLAGRKGNYAAILQALVEEASLPQPSDATESWPTFAGDPSRNRVLPRTTGRLARLPQLGGPNWTVALDPRASDQEGDAEPVPTRRVISPALAARSLAFYPLIVGDLVLVANARSIMAHELATGRQVLKYDVAPDRSDHELGINSQLPTEPDLSYTLTAAEQRVYARLGTQTIGPRRGNETESFLVCVNLPGTMSRKVERWQVKPTAPEGSPAAFEGAPVVYQGRVYIAMTRLTGVQTHTTLACYDADTGALRWQRDLCDTQEIKEGDKRHRHHLLTLAGGSVIYASHSGAIVALEAASGLRLWALRYPSRGAKTSDLVPSPRALAPCLYADGRIYVAPVDYDRLLCLDAGTGHALWESTPLEVIHLLGVARGRVIFTTSTPRRGIRALDATTGNALRGWFQPADGTDLPTFGRGLLAGDWVFWPTRRTDGASGTRTLDRLYVLNQEEGEVVSFADNIAGNMAAANGCLVIANGTHLFAYVSEEQLLEQREKEAALAPDSGQARLRLALAKAGAGQVRAALEDLHRVEALAKPAERWQGRLLPDTVQRERWLLLLDAAERARQSRRWQEAITYLQQAETARSEASSRLKVRVQLATVYQEAGQPARAVETWQTILSDSTLFLEQIVDPRGRQQSAGAFTASRIRDLIRTFGKHTYDSIEQRARALLATAAGEKRKEVLDRLGREFPNAEITPRALLDLAHAYDESGQAGAAAQTYRALLRRSAQAVDRSLALFGLARALEKQQCWSAARLAWQQLATEQGDHIFAPINAAQPVRTFVTERLAGREYCETGSTPPDLPLPLTRSWQASGADDVAHPDQHFSLAAGGPWLAAGNEYLFSVCGHLLSCRQVLTGEFCWEKPLPERASWIGCHADLVLAASHAGIFCFRRADGEPVWSWVPAAEDRLTSLTNFQFAGPRLVFLQDERCLIALDVETGECLWNSWAPAAKLRLPFPSGRFQPHFLATEHLVVIQTTKGQWHILDARSGRLLEKRAAVPEPSRRPLRVLDDGRICLATDAEHITLLDPVNGKELWTHALGFPMSNTGVLPQILGHHKALLLLVSRNYGSVLVCLDPQTGKPCWSEERYLGAGPVDLEAGTLDDTAVYLFRDHVLQAYALQDGSPLWQFELPSRAKNWRVLRAQDYLVVYPLPSQALHLQAHWLRWSVQLELPRNALTPESSVLPILLCDPKHGKLIQRLNFSSPDSSSNAQVRSHSFQELLPQIHFEYSDKAASSLSVRFSSRGLLVVLGNKAWSLTP